MPRLDKVRAERRELGYEKNYRIKTMKIAGAISQGICFPLSILTQRKEEYRLGEDVTEVLEFAHGPSMIGDTTRESIVFRTKDGIKSFEAVDPLFLLKYDE